jgi:hypothetical protein
VKDKIIKNSIVLILIIFIGYFIYIVAGVYFGNKNAYNVWQTRLSKLDSITLLDNTDTIAKSNPPNTDFIDGTGRNTDSIYAATDLNTDGILIETSKQVEKNLINAGFEMDTNLKITTLGTVEIAMQGYKNPNDDYIIVQYAFSKKICAGRTCIYANEDTIKLDSNNQMLLNESINRIRVELMSKNRYVELMKYTFNEFENI